MGHVVCPYPDEVLDKWDSVANPIGKECHDCEVYECEHNPNPDPEGPIMPGPEDLEPTRS